MSFSTLSEWHAIVGGQWIAASTGDWFEVSNPVNRSVVGRVANCGAPEAEAALAAAVQSFSDWSAQPPALRATFLLRWLGLLEAHAEDLAQLITRELGKTIRDSRAEVAYGNGYVRWFAEEARRAYGTQIPSPVPGRQLLAMREPVGVVAVITPWNFPYAMLARKIAPALASGCTVLVRPAEDTPITALYMARLAQEAGLPAGVLNVLPSSRSQVQVLTDVWMASDRVRKVSFTGSTPVGKGIAQRASATLKRLSLELGGNAPFIVFDDADLDAAVRGAVAAKFRNNGQTCVSPNRFMVQAGCYPAFVAKLTQAVSKLVVGEPSEATTDVGPLVNETAVGKVRRHVEDALAHGAELHLGGHALDSQGPLYFQPTVLSGLTQAMAIFREETFGPVIAVMPFTDEAHALALANNTQAGLAGYFYGLSGFLC